jgi:hypothetical protein
LLRSLLPAGLRWRLTAWVAAMMVVFAAAVFVVVYRDTGTQLTNQIDHDISGDTAQLEQALRPSAGRGPAAISAAAARYVRALPYTASSKLLFVFVPGAPTVSNHPEVFGGQPEGGEGAAEQRPEVREARQLAVPHLGYSDQRVADVGRVRILERPVDLGGVRVILGAAAPLELVRNAQHGVARAFLLAGAILLALALLASYFAGAKVSAPLRRMAAVATRVEAGDLELTLGRFTPA